MDYNRIAVISPHFDDGVWSLGLCIKQWLDEGKEIVYINVFTEDEPGAYGPFQKSVLAKMGIDRKDYLNIRRDEDQAALSLLGVTEQIDLGFTEALFRESYSFESLNNLHPNDHELIAVIAERLRSIEADLWLFPSAMANHRDHQILCTLAAELEDSHALKYYAEFPYSAHTSEWSEIYHQKSPSPKELDFRVRLLNAYPTQVKALSIGTDAKGWNYSEYVLNSPPSTNQMKEEMNKNFKDLLGTFRFSHPSYLLIQGSGKALDIGCGPAPHRALIEEKGYEWIGMDLHPEIPSVLEGSVENIPFENELSLLNCWQVLEYVKEPKKALEQMHKALAEGGQLILSVSSLEPVHGHTYHSLSYHWLKESLEDLGFEDIEIRPGTNGIYLILWTFFSKTKLFAPRMWALIFTSPIIIALSALYAAGILGKAIGGNGYLKDWVCRVFPLEFAGHLIVRARKSKMNG